MNSEVKKVERLLGIDTRLKWHNLPAPSPDQIRATCAYSGYMLYVESAGINFRWWIRRMSKADPTHGHFIDKGYANTIPQAKKDARAALLKVMQ